jgi:hypothetical protein
MPHLQQFGRFVPAPKDVAVFAIIEAVFATFLSWLGFVFPQGCRCPLAPGVEQLAQNRTEGCESGARRTRPSRRVDQEPNEEEAHN